VARGEQYLSHVSKRVRLIFFLISAQLINRFPTDDPEYEKKRTGQNAPQIVDSDEDEDFMYG
jgi:hypothetical protein